MSTRDDEIKKAVDELIGLSMRTGIYSGQRHMDARNESRARLLALLSPPAPAAITEAQIEAGAKALLLIWQGAETDDLFDDPDWRHEYQRGARIVLEAAAQAQPGGEARDGE